MNRGSRIIVNHECGCCTFTTVEKSSQNVKIRKHESHRRESLLQPASVFHVPRSSRQRVTLAARHLVLLHPSLVCVELNCFSILQLNFSSHCFISRFTDAGTADNTEHIANSPRNTTLGPICPAEDTNADTSATSAMIEHPEAVDVVVEVDGIELLLPLCLLLAFHPACVPRIWHTSSSAWVP